MLPNAKINLGLNVVSRRADGYHNIETVFYPIPLCDMLEVVILDGSQPYEWHCSGLQVDVPPEKNICIKALNLVAKQHKLPSLGVHLHKIIPFGAGLGGGSSDGAFMVKLLNNMFELGMSNDEMCDIVVKIGADCPFFIKNTPSFASGIGDVLQPIDLSLKGVYITLVKPDIFISTPEAYKGVTPHASKYDLMDIVSKPIEFWPDLLQNDFEDNIFQNHPTIAAIKKQLYDAGCVYASMSGSGSSVFGLSRKPIDADFDDCFVWTGML